MLSAAPRRVYTIVIKIIVDISPATVPAPPFCPNYFLTRPIKGAGPWRYGGCSSGSSRRHNRKTGRPSVIKTARVGVQTSLALSSSRSLIFFPFFPYLSVSLSERRDSFILPLLDLIFVLYSNEMDEIQVWNVAYLPRRFQTKHNVVHLHIMSQQRN